MTYTGILYDKIQYSCATQNHISILFFFGKPLNIEHREHNQQHHYTGIGIWEYNFDIIEWSVTNDNDKITICGFYFNKFLSFLWHNAIPLKSTMTGTGTGTGTVLWIVVWNVVCMPLATIIFINCLLYGQQ